MSSALLSSVLSMQVKSSSDSRFTIVMIIWGSIALLLAIVTIISVVITHRSETDTTQQNYTIPDIETTPASIYTKNTNSQKCPFLLIYNPHRTHFS